MRENSRGHTWTADLAANLDSAKPHKSRRCCWPNV